MAAGESTAEGLAWTGTGKAVAEVIGLGVTLVLARLLTPEDFGLVEMIAVVIGFLAVFGEMGFASALIQRSEIEERHRSTVFWLNVAVGLVLGGALFALAPLLAHFYRNERLLWLIRVLCLDFVLAPFGMVQHAVLARASRFRSLALADMVAALASNAVGLGLALAGFGVWALVGKLLAATAGGVLSKWWLSSWRPKLTFRKSALGDLFGFGANLLGYTTIDYWAGKVDDLLVGRVLGARALGLYGRAFSTLMMPVGEVGGVISRVMFPAFSRLQHEPREMKALYLRMVSVLAFAVFPVMFLLAVMSEPFIRVLYGAQWLGAATVLSIYCVAGASHAVGSTVAFLYKATGRTDWMLRWGLFAGSLTIASFGVGIAFGSIESVAACYAVVTVLVLGYPRFAIVGKLVGMKPGEVFGAVRGALGCAVLVAALAWGLGRLHLGLAPALDFFLRFGLGLIGYVALSRVFRVRGLGELREAIQRWAAAGSPGSPAEGEQRASTPPPQA
jgi:O-antigen/teichoic acid export membrane protein